MIIPCAIKNCKKTSNKKKFGRGETLNPTFASLFPDEIKDRHEHQDEVCDTHARRIRRRLESFTNNRLTLLTSAVDQVLRATSVLSTPPLLTEQPALANHQSVSVSDSPAQSSSQPLTVLVSPSQTPVQPISILLEQSTLITIPTPAQVNRQVNFSSSNEQQHGVLSSPIRQLQILPNTDPAMMNDNEMMNYVQRQLSLSSSPRDRVISSVIRGARSAFVSSVSPTSHSSSTLPSSARPIISPDHRGFDRKSKTREAKKAAVDEYASLGNDRIKKKEFRAKRNYDAKELSRWKMALQNNQGSALKRKRSRGGGCTPILKVHEDEIAKWINQKRDGTPAEPVSTKSLLRHVNKTYSELLRENKKLVSVGWAKGFLRRNHFARRKRTTNKDLNSPLILNIIAAYRLRLKNERKIFDNYDHKLIWNMDETGVYYDNVPTHTINAKGAKSVSINSSGHEKDRVTAVLCCNANGDKMPALIITKSSDRTKLNVIERKPLEIKKGEWVDVFITQNKNAWMTKEAMENWLQLVYMENDNKCYNNNNDDGIFSSFDDSHARSVLFMDNCGPHKHESIKHFTNNNNIQCEFFPPKCTPHLQPLDHSLNAKFKRLLEELSNEWFYDVGKNSTTPKGNFKKADKNEIIKWVATAWEFIEREHIKRCWDYTLIGEKILIIANERIKNCGDIKIKLPPPGWPITDEEKKEAPTELFDVEEGRVIDDDDDDDDDDYEEQIVLLSEITNIDVMNNEIDNEAEKFGDKKADAEEDGDTTDTDTETEEKTNINEKENVSVNSSSSLSASSHTSALRSHSNLQREFEVTQAKKQKKTANEVRSSKKPRTSKRTSGRVNQGKRYNFDMPFVADYDEDEWNYY
jgi:hypothetical protein